MHTGFNKRKPKYPICLTYSVSRVSTTNHLIYGVSYKHKLEPLRLPHTFEHGVVEGANNKMKNKLSLILLAIIFLAFVSGIAQ